jgi:hypothetical protein
MIQLSTRFSHANLLRRTRAMSVRATSAPVWSPAHGRCGSSSAPLLVRATAVTRIEIEVPARRLQLAHARRPFDQH